MRHLRCPLVTLDSRVQGVIFPPRAACHEEGTERKREHSFQVVGLSQGPFWSQGDSIMSGSTIDCHDSGGGATGV